MTDLLRTHQGAGYKHRVRVITDRDLVSAGGSYVVDPEAVAFRAYGMSIHDAPGEPLGALTLPAQAIYFVTQAQIDAGQYVLDQGGVANLVEVNPDASTDGFVAVPVLRPGGEWLVQKPGIMVNPVRADLSNFADRNTHLSRILSETGLRRVFQFLPNSVTSGQVDSFLDSCAFLNMTAVLGFRLDMAFSGTWDLTDYTNSIVPNAGHSALAAFRSIDEPLANYTTTAVQILYSQIKNATPNMPVVVQFSGQLESFKYAGTKQFELGMCDICMFTKLPFRHSGQGRTYLDRLSMENQQYTRYIVKQVAGESVELWATAQGFGDSGGEYDMPTLGEFVDLYQVYVSAGLERIAPLDAVCYQHWFNPDVADAAEPELQQAAYAGYRDFIYRVST